MNRNYAKQDLWGKIRNGELSREEFKQILFSVKARNTVRVKLEELLRIKDEVRERTDLCDSCKELLLKDILRDPKERANYDGR